MSETAEKDTPWKCDVPRPGPLGRSPASTLLQALGDRPDVCPRARYQPRGLLTLHTLVRNHERQLQTVSYLHSCLAGG